MFSAAWWGRRAKGSNPGRIDPRFTRLFRALVEPVLRVFHRPTMEGVENIPRDRPFLLVANHSGGMAISEVLCLIVMYFRHLEGVRIAALAHPFSFHFWPMPYLMRALGAVPSTYEGASAAFADGASVLVFPGGDYEATRPFWQAYRVDFNRRKGFLDLARRAGVPIVPMGISGSHNSVPILARSDFFLAWALIIPRVFGVKRYPVTLVAAVGVVTLLAWIGPAYGWGLAAGAAWLWMASPYPLIPILPTTIRYRIGPALEPEELFSNEYDPDTAYDTVRDRIQSLVHR